MFSKFLSSIKKHPRDNVNCNIYENDEPVKLNTVEIGEEYFYIPQLRDFCGYVIIKSALKHGYVTIKRTNPEYYHESDIYHVIHLGDKEKRLFKKKNKANVVHTLTINPLYITPTKKKNETNFL
jgi:hypothetical protein